MLFDVLFWFLSIMRVTNRNFRFRSSRFHPNWSHCNLYELNLNPPLVLGFGRFQLSNMLFYALSWFVSSSRATYRHFWFRNINFAPNWSHLNLHEPNLNAASVLGFGRFHFSKRLFNALSWFVSFMRATNRNFRFQNLKIAWEYKIM